jgi:hypothetical protein
MQEYGVTANTGMTDDEMLEAANRSRGRQFGLSDDLAQDDWEIISAARSADAVRAQQQALATEIAAGGVSPAELQMRQGLNQGQMQALAIAGGSRGNQGLAYRAAQQAGGQSAMGTVAQGAGMRAQEQVARQGRLADVYGNVRQGDVATAGLYGQAGGLGLEQRAQEVSRENAFVGMGVGNERRRAELAAQNEANRSAREAAGIGAIGTFAAALSDRRGKRDIGDGDDRAEQFLDALASLVARRLPARGDDY